MALGTVMVISAIPIPPAIIASAALKASSGEGARTIGTRPTSRMSVIDLSFTQATRILLVKAYSPQSTRRTQRGVRPFSDRKLCFTVARLLQPNEPFYLKALESAQ